MIKIGNFEIEYDKNAPDAVTVKIEADKNGEVWLPKCDIARAYGVFVPVSYTHLTLPTIRLV